MQDKLQSNTDNENNIDNLSIRGILKDWFIGSLLWIRGIKIKKFDSRRFWPLLVIVVIAIVTITHEATYAGSFEKPGYEYIGWFYAIAINISIIISEYFTGWATTRRYAWISFVVVTFGSGLLNIAYVKPWTHVGVEEIFAWVYAALPTIIIVSLGFLSSNVAKLAKKQESSWDKADAPKEYECFCGEQFLKPIQLAGHAKQHIKEIRDMQFNNGVAGLKYLKETYPGSKVGYPELNKINGWISKE